MRLFFDVDGVLIEGWHSDPARRRRWDVTLAEDLGVSSSAFEAAFFQPPPGGDASPMLRCVRGECDLHAELARILPGLGYAGTVEEFSAYWFAKDARVNRPLWALVERLAENPALELYVATQQEHRRAAHLWGVLGFRRYFRRMFYSAELGHLKTSPDFFRAVDRALGPVSAPSLLIDDSALVCETAVSAGWQACLFGDPGDLAGHPLLRSLLASGGGRPEDPEASDT